MLSPQQVESEICRLSDRLDEETSRYATLADVAAEREVDYRLGSAKALLNMPTSERRLTVLEREAIVLAECAHEFSEYKIAEARREATAQALRTLRARIDALRTLSANARSLGA